jgi:hypothetical protein
MATAIPLRRIPIERIPTPLLGRFFPFNPNDFADIPGARINPELRMVKVLIAFLRDKGCFAPIVY